MIRLVLLCSLAGALFAQSNGDFEAGNTGEIPTGWVLPAFSAKAGFTAKLVEEDCRTGRCAQISGVPNAPADVFGNLLHSMPAADHRLRRVRLSAAIRVEGDQTRAQMWLRLDTDSGMAFLDNMSNRPIRSSQWQTYTIETDVSPEVQKFVFGVMLFGPGHAWVDDVKLEAIGEIEADKTEPARPLTDRGVRNVTAFSRLYGYVRFFHPSDQVEKADWEAFAVDGVRAIEDAGSDSELAARLQKLFAPVAPTIRVFSAGGKPETVALPRGPELIYRVHHGIGLASNVRTPYSSKRERMPAKEAASPQVFEAEVVRGLKAAVPLEVYVDGNTTLPAVELPEAKKVYRSALDRGTRLGAVVIAWNVMQHFYPYFDVVKTDWAAEQPKALRAAATEATAVDFHKTLRRMVAALKDGHGNVQAPSQQMLLVAPVTLDFVEDELVVTRVHKDGPKDVAPGDRVLKIDGQPAASAIAESRSLISGATEQWIRHTSSNDLARCYAGKQLNLELESVGGETKSVTLTCAPPRWRTVDAFTEPRPEEVFQQLEPGFYYVDLTRIGEGEWKKIIPELENAKGILFDMRGYPGQPGIQSLAHLTEKTIRCARWNIPTPRKPDLIDVTFAESGWDVPPQAPYLKAPRAFLTDGRAISYAETVMGIVENYKLGEIVGGPTAGTNGNVNPLRLPGGYTIYWTGMKVLKHDKSQHHGIGILPTVPVTRTRKGVAEGKDEILLRGLEVVKAKAQ